MARDKLVEWFEGKVTNMIQAFEHAKPTWMDETLNDVTLVGWVQLYTRVEAEAATGNKLAFLVCEPIYFAPIDEEHDEWQVGLVR